MNTDVDQLAEKTKKSKLISSLPVGSTVKTLPWGIGLIDERLYLQSQFPCIDSQEEVKDFSLKLTIREGYVEIDLYDLSKSTSPVMIAKTELQRDWGLLPVHIMGSKEAQPAQMIGGKWVGDKLPKTFTAPDLTMLPDDSVVYICPLDIEIRPNACFCLRPEVTYSKEKNGIAITRLSKKGSTIEIDPDTLNGVNIQFNREGIADYLPVKLSGARGAFLHWAAKMAWNMGLNSISTFSQRLDNYLDASSR